MSIERIVDEQTLRASGEVGARAFGLSLDALQRVVTPMALSGPGINAFLARYDGRPASTVWTIQAGPVVGIWSMATAPEVQRRRVGRALLDQVLAHHQERGATDYYLLATEAGYPLYERIGFRSVTQPSVWVAGNSVQVAS